MNRDPLKEKADESKQKRQEEISIYPASHAGCESVHWGIAPFTIRLLIHTLYGIIKFGESVGNAVVPYIKPILISITRMC